MEQHIAAIFQFFVLCAATSTARSTLTGKPFHANMVQCLSIPASTQRLIQIASEQNLTTSHVYVINKLSDENEFLSFLIAIAEETLCVGFLINDPWIIGKNLYVVTMKLECLDAFITFYFMIKPACMIIATKDSFSKDWKLLNRTDCKLFHHKFQYTLIAQESNLLMFAASRRSNVVEHPESYLALTLNHSFELGCTCKPETKERMENFSEMLHECAFQQTRTNELKTSSKSFIYVPIACIITVILGTFLVKSFKVDETV